MKEYMRYLDILSLLALVAIGAFAVAYDARIAFLAVVPGMHLASRLYSCRTCEEDPPSPTLYSRVVTQHGHTWTCRFFEDDGEVAGVATLNVTEVPSKMVANVFIRDHAVDDRPVGNIDEAEAWIRQERNRRLQAIGEAFAAIEQTQALLEDIECQ